MPTTLDRARVKQHLDNFDLRALFTQELGWDHGGSDTEITVKDRAYPLQAVAHKRGMVAYQHLAQPGDDFPDRPTRQKIERAVAKQVREHIIIFCPHDRSAQYWLWVKREPGRPDRTRPEKYQFGQSGERLIQKLEAIVFTLDEEADLSIVDVTGRVRAAFDVEKVTKKFYDRFKEEHQDFLGFIEGINNLADREWYASLMLNRMMFIYFIQKRSFLDNDPDYLRHRLQTVRRQHGAGRFAGFYRLFLLKLFHEGLGQPEAERDQELDALLGRVPYLNGGLFDVHDLERDHPDIDIPDEAFEKIFAFFDAYQWHLDDRPLRDDNEINPDVLGYIFEKYINQKQMGAYYTKEDITGYISRNTIIPFLFDRAQKGCAIAFRPDGIWQLLQDDPDSYFYEAVRHGITYDIHENEALDQKQELPADIAAGLDNVAQRGDWNKPAPDAYALPTETWREHVARRRRYQEIYAKLEAGDVTSINDLITYNLNIEKFAQDVIANSEGPELVRAFWKALSAVSVLDPTCGSGAFLFAALNILEPLYSACLEAMEGFLDDLERSQRPHSPQALSDFRKVLAQIEEHVSNSYFILKSIIIGNLYGVDIMEEAVEICKLRLFLKLVAQLKTYDQIEPLPDIDFNVRAGNTLVGFTTLQEIRDSFAGTPGGQSRMLYAEEEEELRRIEEDAHIADRQFQLFHEMQTEYGMDAADFADAKLTLRQRLDALRAELDRYLAKEYGVRARDEEPYAQWRASHQPFHWFVEFYGIMHEGGFDVIIGNPPYLEAKEVLYSPRYFETESSRAIHAMCVERGTSLCKGDGGVSMIVPLALVSTQRMKVLQHLLEKNRDCWYSNFAWRPGKLFDTVNRALTIFLSTKPKKSGSTFSTAYLKWNSSSRNFLIPILRYAECPRNRNEWWVPKLGVALEDSILRKFCSIGRTMESLSGRTSSRVYYRKDGGLYWKVFTDFAPAFHVNGVAASSSREIHFTLAKKNHVKPAVAILSSNLFWWWYTITSNLRHVNPSDWKHFPVPHSAMDDPVLHRLGTEYLADLRRHSTMLIRNQKSTGRTETQSFKIQYSKPIIDQIDRALAPHYGFTDEELDFIINYDIKYRMGR